MLHKLCVLVLPLKDTSKGISTGSTLVCYSLSLPSGLTGLLPLWSVHRVRPVRAHARDRLVPVVCSNTVAAHQH